MDSSIEVSHLGAINDILQRADRRRGYSWGIVRSLGELQVLTRASYLMLVFVPLLAGLWPAVSILVNQYNATIESSIDKLTIAADALRVEAARLDETHAPFDQTLFDQVNETLQDLEKGLCNLAQNLDKKTIESSKLPKVWVWAFLASLATMVGHTIYQLAAPTVVQRFSRREYINGILDDAIKVNPNIATEDSTELTRVVQNADEQYFKASVSAKHWAYVSMFFYVIAVFLILAVIGDQTWNVLKNGRLL